VLEQIASGFGFVPLEFELSYGHCLIPFYTQMCTQGNRCARLR
jgi:hypothetical protein